MVIPAPKGNEPDKVLVNWTSTGERSYEKRFHRDKLSICAKELVHGGFYSPKLLPVVKILVDEDPLSSRR